MSLEAPNHYTAWKLHFEGYGKGVYKPPTTPVTSGNDLNALSNALIKQDNDGPKNVTPPIQDPAHVLPGSVTSGQLPPYERGLDPAKPAAAIPSAPAPPNVQQPAPATKEPSQGQGGASVSGSITG